jgi:hypothetical protein
MEERGVTVLTVRDILSYNCDKNIKDRVELEELAVQSKIIILKKLAIVYDLHDGNEVQNSYITDDYKRECLSSMGVHDLVDLILMGPNVKLVPSTINTPVRVQSINMNPLLNLTFCRGNILIL